ncbi:MAG TPA: hypothetical protein GX497_12620 [Bacillus bacterium]|nr:hypothetical protein [Bacillus sp. (in: firmicutes)]
MSLFGYHATIKHYKANIDSWGRVSGYLEPIEKAAKVIEEQKLIRTTNKVGVKAFSSEEIISVAEIHIEGLYKVGMHDYFEYTNELNETLKFEVKHIEVKKLMGTDEVKKVVVYG